MTIKEANYILTQLIEQIPTQGAREFEFISVVVNPDSHIEQLKIIYK